MYGLHALGETMSKGSGRRQENIKQVERNLSKVKHDTFKPSRVWESAESQSRPKPSRKKNTDTRND